MAARVFIRELVSEGELDQVFLCRRVERAQRKDGEPYIRLQFADRTGAVKANLWEPSAQLESFLEEGKAVHVQGRYRIHPTYGPEIKVERLGPPAPGTFALEDLTGGPAKGAEALEEELRGLVGAVKDRHLRALLEAVFATGSPLWPRFREAPAAKLYHQAYRHGLLEHTVAVAKTAAHLAGERPSVDRDLVLSGALLHDLGKVEAYTVTQQGVELTDQGRLLGEIALGYYLVRRQIEAQPEFPPRRAVALLHIVLSHHGALEHGSPVLPATREAVLVHLADNIDSKLGAFDRLEEELAPGSAWSSFDRALGTSAFFGR